MSVNTNASSPIHPSYLSVSDDVIPWMQAVSGTAIGTVQLGNLQLITDMACDWCAGYLGRPVGPETFDRRFDGTAGWGGAYIMLPFYPVLEIASVTEYRGTSGAYVLAESSPTVQVDGWTCSYATGRLNRVFPGNVQKPWFPGSRNIEVVWSAGYNPVPPVIRVATLELISHWYRNTQQQGGRIGGGAITPSAEYDPAGGIGMFAGVPYRITTLLAPYIAYNLA